MMNSSSPRKSHRIQSEVEPPNRGGRPRNEYAGKFGAFVMKVLPENLATELNVDPAAVYQWLRGEHIPRPKKALAIVEIARREGVTLSLEDIYVHALTR